MKKNSKQFEFVSEQLSKIGKEVNMVLQEIDRDKLAVTNLCFCMYS